MMHSANRFLNDGWYPSLRGALEGRHEIVDDPMFSFTGGATTTKSFDVAKNMNPEHKHVLAMMEEGITVVELFTETPDDVCTYRKRKSNNFHDGHDDNFLDVVQEVPVIREAFDQYLEMNHIKRSSCPTRIRFFLWRAR